MSDEITLIEPAVSRFASRKFVLALLAILLASALVCCGKIDGGVYSVIVVAALGGYLAANVTQKATT